ncbi:Secreted hydrolase-like protein [Apiospora arundinis]
MEPTDSSTDYVLGRDPNASIRLDAQHLLWRMHRGHILDPMIQVREDMAIAELGCGTGCWLFDLAQQLPISVQLHGYDISDEQFPAADLWPHNVELGVLDSLADPPAFLKAKYDVIHLRMWASNVGTSDSRDLIRHASKLLKPGGYIQWEEADLIHQVVSPGIAKEIEHGLTNFFKLVGLDYSWAHKLPATLESEGLAVLHYGKDAFQGYSTYLCTTTYLAALLEIITGIVRSGRTSRTVADPHMTAVEELLKRRTGAIVYNWGPLSILAKKPASE